jgi:D-inositol-3-phosphate glycosyltransferase
VTSGGRIATSRDAGDTVLPILRQAFDLAAELRETRATLEERGLEIESLASLLADRQHEIQSLRDRLAQPDPRLVAPPPNLTLAPVTTRLARLLRRLVPAPLRDQTRRWRARLSGAEQEAWSLGSRGWAFRGSFDNPARLARRVQTVTGWVLHRHQAISTVELTLNGRRLGAARIGMARPDIARYFRERDADIAGFQLDVDFAEALQADEGLARLQAFVRTTEGETFTLSSLGIPVRPGAPPPRARTAPYVASVSQARRARRALVFTHSLGLGGAQIYLTDLLSRLVRDWEWAATVVAPQDGVLRSDLEAAGIKVHLVPGYGEYDPQSYRSIACELAELGRESRCDVVLVNTMGAFLGIEVAAQLGVPSVWMIHESFPLRVYWKVGFPHRLSEVVRACAEQALDRVSLAAFPAQATRRLYDDWIDPSRSVVLPYGIDLARWDTPPEDRRRQVRERFGLAPEAFVVVSVGTVEPRKGQTRIAQAFRDVLASHPNACLVLVGETAPESEFGVALRGFLNRNSIQDRVLIRPVGNEVPDWFAAADLVVLASDVEALPLCLIEAMASGVCVAAAEVFGVPELIQDGREGFLFPPNDIAAMRAALDRVMRMSATQRRLIAQSGQARARTMDADQYARVFVEAVSSIRCRSVDNARPGAESRSAGVAGDRTAKLAFVHFPKAGGTYVDNYLGTHVLGPAGYAFYNAGGWGLGRDWTVGELDEVRRRQDALAYVHNHASGWTRDALLRFREDGWFTFAFVRNPGDQLCSYFFWRRAQIHAGQLSESLAPQEWDWLSRASLDGFLRSALCGERFADAVAELDPTPWVVLLDFCEELNDSTFGRFLQEHLGHEYRPAPRLNPSGSRGLKHYIASGEITRETEDLLLNHGL